MSTLSVLICTYNRPKMLLLSLSALINRTLEIPDQIVIVNGGDERTDLIVQDFISKTRIKIDLIKTVNKNLAASRNLGLACCTGDIIAMTDDDAEVFPDWVTQMKKAHAEHPEAGGIGGAVLGADSETNLLSRIADLTVFSSPAKPQYVRTIPGVNVSYKRSVIQAVGVQDENLFRGEDVDFNWRIKQIGYEIYYLPTIKVTHHHRPTLRGLINQFYMYGRAYYLVRCKWPEMYCVYPHEFKRAKDFFKAIYFLVNVVFMPMITASKMPRWSDRILSVPVIFASQIAWRSGVLRQKLIFEKGTCQK